MNGLTAAFLIVLAAGVALIGLDFFLYAKHGTQGTISWELYQLAKSEPIVACAIGLVGGILLGHFFWPQRW